MSMSSQFGSSFGSDEGFLPSGKGINAFPTGTAFDKVGFWTMRPEEGHGGSPGKRSLGFAFSLYCHRIQI
ncbi:hypothetical protein DY000_02061932 [Brassica cretica]|uniref:Neprosin domain-containing protein n=1 Tax=Brassica cretica TaxID=69181 RepID=A0ABQ7AR62_BRACR|nr:hypothetical protein DY000_02061932 [Brassica cretica]